MQTNIKTRYQRVKQLFFAALENPAASRLAWLLEVCAEDAELLAEVWSLIVLDQQVPDYELRPATESLEIQVLVDKIDALAKQK